MYSEKLCWRDSTGGVFRRITKVFWVNIVESILDGWKLCERQTGLKRQEMIWVRSSVRLEKYNVVYQKSGMIKARFRGAWNTLWVLNLISAILCPCWKRERELVLGYSEFCYVLYLYYFMPYLLYSISLNFHNHTRK